MRPYPFQGARPSGPSSSTRVLLEDKTPVELLAPSGHKDDITRARTLLGSMKYKAEEMEHPVPGQQHLRRQLQQGGLARPVGPHDAEMLRAVHPAPHAPG